MTLVAKKKIDLNCRGRHVEGKLTGVVKPGYLLRPTGTFDDAGTTRLTFAAHNVAGGPAAGYFAKEDAYQGKTYEDAYANGDRVFVVQAARGDHVNVKLAAGALAVTVTDFLISAGDGTMKKASADVGEQVFASTAASTALNTHTTLTAFDVKHTIPAGQPRVGDVYHVRAVVLFANASNSTETVLITLKLGSLTIIATAALDNAAADIAVIDAYLHFRAVGASGSVLAYGTQSIGAPGTATAKPFYTAAQSVDTTAALDITVNQTCSGSHANTGGQLVELNVDRANTDPGAVLAQPLEAVDNSAEVTEAFCPAVIL